MPVLSPRQSCLLLTGRSHVRPARLLNVSHARIRVPGARARSSAPAHFQVLVFTAPSRERPRLLPDCKIRMRPSGQLHGKDHQGPGAPDIDRRGMFECTATGDDPAHDSGVSAMWSQRRGRQVLENSEREACLLCIEGVVEQAPKAASLFHERRAGRSWPGSRH